MCNSRHFKTWAELSAFTTAFQPKGGKGGGWKGGACWVWRGVWCAEEAVHDAYPLACGAGGLLELPLGVRSTLLSLAETRSGAAVGKDSVLRGRLLRDPSTSHLAAATQPSETNAPAGIPLRGRRSGKHVRCRSFVRRRYLRLLGPVPNGRSFGDLHAYDIRG